VYDTLNELIESLHLRDVIKSRKAYRKLDEIIERFVINHSTKEYVRGAIHTNTIEGF
jgi:hypothetical protein